MDKAWRRIKWREKNEKRQLTPLEKRLEIKNVFERAAQREYAKMYPQRPQGVPAEPEAIAAIVKRLRAGQVSAW